MCACALYMCVYSFPQLVVFEMTDPSFCHHQSPPISARSFLTLGGGTTGHRRAHTHTHLHTHTYQNICCVLLRLLRLSFPSSFHPSIQTSLPCFSLALLSLCFHAQRSHRDGLIATFVELSAESCCFWLKTRFGSFIFFKLGRRGSASVCSPKAALIERFFPFKDNLLPL